MSKLVAAILPDRHRVADALARLEREGFARDQISVLASEESHGTHFAIVEHTKAAEGGALGGLAGAVIGAVAGAVILPGIGAGVGPVVAALAGAGAGATAGGVTGALVGRGMPEHEAKIFHGEVQRGGILVGVETDDREQARIAAGNLEAAGATRITDH